MSKLALMIVSIGIDSVRPNISMRAFVETGGPAEGRSTVVPRWISALALLFARKSKADQFEDSTGAFYIGAGDQFDDDRRRIHVVR
jgi:hypothetical protein